MCNVYTWLSFRTFLFLRPPLAQLCDTVFGTFNACVTLTFKYSLAIEKALFAHAGCPQWTAIIKASACLHSLTKSPCVCRTHSNIDMNTVSRLLTNSTKKEVAYIRVPSGWYAFCLKNSYCTPPG